uniref:Uncharacterized protein n=1 Tax=Anguilla anguilla TaxID=7936 RepID=A0A0E9VG05_ANGAN
MQKIYIIEESSLSQQYKKVNVGFGSHLTITLFISLCFTRH